MCVCVCVSFFWYVTGMVVTKPEKLDISVWGISFMQDRAMLIHISAAGVVAITPARSGRERSVLVLYKIESNAHPLFCCWVVDITPARSGRERRYMSGRLSGGCRTNTV